MPTMKIVYTYTDEAPALATLSLLPIILAHVLVACPGPLRVVPEPAGCHQPTCTHDVGMAVVLNCKCRARLTGRSARRRRRCVLTL